MKRLSSLSIFLPAYNDAGTITELVLKAEQTARSLTDEFELIVVNDGSEDDTATVLANLKTRIPRLRVITHPVNRGYGGALRSGFAAARGDWVFYTDGDGQYDPAELTCLVDALHPGLDLVNGYKRRRHDPWIRVVLGALYNSGVRWLFGLRLRDVDCDFRLIRRATLIEIELESDSGAICVELIRGLQDRGARFAEVAVSHYRRRQGASQFFNGRRVFDTARQVVRLWWRLAVGSADPRRQHDLG